MFVNLDTQTCIHTPLSQYLSSVGVQISTSGCTIFGGVHPVCVRVLSYLLLLYIRRVHGEMSGCKVLWDMHPASAQNKSLISDTA